MNRYKELYKIGDTVEHLDTEGRTAIVFSLEVKGRIGIE